MIRELPTQDPREVRRALQPRYDSYMGGKRLLLGVDLPGFDVTMAGNSVEERAQAYKAFAERWPKRSRNLMAGIAKELVFTAFSYRNHEQQVNRLFPAIMDAHIEEATLGFVSGLGRNAVLLSRIKFVPGEEPRVSTVVGTNTAVARLYEQADIQGILFDPDFGMGDITGPTPEVFDDAGSEALALSTFIPRRGGLSSTLIPAVASLH